MATPRRALTRLTLVAICSTALCGCHQDPQTEAERLAHGRELVEKMSSTLESAPAFSFTTREVRVLRPAPGKTRTVTLTRRTVVRRPDRLYFKTSGDNETEGWYDGIGLTVVMHKDKVFGQARLPETLDRALDAISERYGVALPVGDYMYSSPARALLSSNATGGWAGREQAGNETLDHLYFQDGGVSWHLWLPASGQPLPRKIEAVLRKGEASERVQAEFSEWNLEPEIPATMFDPRVPADYEGIAIIQRAAILKAQAP